jgi:tRNA A37 threonylcarbamoyladenosine dehydratase
VFFFSLCIDARNDSELLNSEIKKLSRKIHGQLKRKYSGNFLNVEVSYSPCILVEMKDSLEKHESGHQLADYRIMETQVACVLLYKLLCHCEVVYAVFSTFSEVQECHR